MFSIIIPLYNKEDSVVSTVQSILHQSCADFEVIVVNDGSTDSSTERLAEISDKRIRLIDQDNGGVSRARNVGIENATSDYIAFLDADDQWHPSHNQLPYQNRMSQSSPSNRCQLFLVPLPRQYSDLFFPVIQFARFAYLSF